MRVARNDTLGVLCTSLLAETLLASHLIVCLALLDELEDAREAVLHAEIELLVRPWRDVDVVALATLLIVRLEREGTNNLEVGLVAHIRGSVLSVQNCTAPITDIRALY